MAKQRPFDAVQFTRESAERIANVVRSAETTPPAASPLTFDRLIEGRAPKQVRAATFSGAWPIGSSKVVTFTNMPTNTASVQNLSWPISAAGYANEPCLVGKDGTAWYLIVPVLSTATAVFVTQTQQQTFCSQTGSQAVVTGVVASLNTTNCVISVTTTTAAVTIVSQTATAVFIASTAASSYLRLRVP